VKRFSKHEIISEINNGNEEVLVYLSGKYFPTARRLMRIRGFRDDVTPEIFSEVLAKVYSGLRSQDAVHFEFEPYFLSKLNEEIKSRKEGRQMNHGDGLTAQPEAVSAKCVQIMDEETQQLLYSRVAENLSYERIAEKFQFSNAVIAQYEVNKALNQLEGIVKLRMNIS